LSVRKPECPEIASGSTGEPAVFMKCYGAMRRTRGASGPRLRRTSAWLARPARSECPEREPLGLRQVRSQPRGQHGLLDQPGHVPVGEPGVERARAAVDLDLAPAGLALERQQDADVLGLSLELDLAAAVGRVVARAVEPDELGAPRPGGEAEQQQLPGRAARADSTPAWRPS
jgi:hypothetical protein